jgi:WD40 repeat protein/serine/threonine protein kinase
VLALAEEFLGRHRQGERPSLKEYIDRHPELAAEIREVFPAMALMENIALADESLAGAPADDGQAKAPAPLQQLGDYRIIRQVGRGGMGVVYEAEQVSLGRHVALKVLPQKVLLDARQRRRFEREARAAARLHHTNIVPVFGVGEHEGMPYYVMQFIQGQGLDQVLDELKRYGPASGGRPSPDDGKDQGADAPRSRGQRAPLAADVARSLLTGAFQRAGSLASPADATVDVPPGMLDEPTPPAGLPPVSGSVSSSSVILPGQSRDPADSGARRQTYWQGVARIGVQVADALAYAHGQGIQHRDIKPSNLLLDTHGTVWVTDFGLAKADDQANLTQAGDIVGTLRYMPPEAFDGKSDARGDVYALGLTLYELLALRPAFGETDRRRLVKLVTAGEPPRLERLNRAVPRDLVTVVHKAIDRDPVRRYQTAADLAADLQRFLDDEPIRARRPSRREVVWRWCRHHPGVASLTAVLILLMIGVTVASLAAAARLDRLAREQASAAQNERQARRMADESKDDAEAARRKLETTLTDMHTSHGLTAAERGDAAQAMLWFANAARLAGNDPGRAWANRVRVRAWSREAVLPVGALPHANQPLRVVAFQPGGNHLLTLTKQDRCYVWDWRREEPLPWARGESAVRSACWSPDGEWLALGLPSGQVEIRRVPSGDLLHRLDHPGAVTALAFSRDGQHLAIASDVVRVWDCRQHTFAPVAWRHPRPVDALVFSPGGDRLATACLDQQVRVFAVSSEAAMTAPLFAPLRHAPSDQVASPSAPAYIDNGRQLVTITGGTELTCWDAETGKPSKLGRLRTQPFGLGSLAASPDGKSFAAGGYYGPQVWNLSNPGAAGPLLAHRNYVHACAYGPDGTILLTASEDGTAKLWSLPEGKLQGYPLVHQDHVTNAAFSPDGRFLATGQRNGLVRIWRRPEGNPGNHPLRYDHGAMVARLSADGRYVIASRFSIFAWPMNTRRARVYDVDTSRPAGPDFTVEGELREAALSPDGRLAAAASATARAASLQVWEVRTGRATFAPLSLPEAPNSIAFSPDGSCVGVLCAGGQVVVADLGGEAKPRVFSQQPWTRCTFPIGHQLQFTRDGSGLVTTSATEVHVRDAHSGELRYPPLRPTPAQPAADETCVDIALSADGRWLATAIWGGSHTAQVWDLATGKPLCPPLPHPNRLYQVRFSPDGNRILTACCDGQARLWDWATGVLACPPLKHDDEVRSVAFSPDGRWGLTACRDDSVGVWELATGKPLLPRLDLKVWDGGKSVDVAAGGKRAVASVGWDGLLSIDLGDLSAPEDLDLDDLCTLAELASGQRIHEGDLAGLTAEEWLARWRTFRLRHPAYGGQVLEEEVRGDSAK